MVNQITRKQIREFPRKYLIQTPFALYRRAITDSGQILEAFLNNKNVAVIGNAQSLFDRQDGALIDAADVVIRINRGHISEPKSQGTRTDVLALSADMNSALIEESFAPELIVWMSHKSKNFEISGAGQLDKTAFYPRRYYREDRRLLRGKRPSTGFMVIRLLLQNANPKSVSLFGFDFGKTATFYNEPGYESPHDYAAEHAYVLGAQKQGQLTISMG